MMGIIVLLGRICFGLIFLLSAPNHFKAGTIAYAASSGAPLPSISVPLSGVLALLGSLSIIFGFHARLGALLIIIFLVAITPVMHNFWALTEPQAAMIQRIMFLKNLSMLGGALVIAYFGSGPFSIR